MQAKQHADLVLAADELTQYVQVRVQVGLQHHELAAQVRHLGHFIAHALLLKQHSHIGHLCACDSVSANPPPQHARGARKASVTLHSTPCKRAGGAPWSAGIREGQHAERREKKEAHQPKRLLQHAGLLAVQRLALTQRSGQHRVVGRVRVAHDDGRSSHARAEPHDGGPSRTAKRGPSQKGEAYANVESSSVERITDITNLR